MDIKYKIHNQICDRLENYTKTNIREKVSTKVSNQVWNFLAQNIYFSVRTQIFEQFILSLNPDINRGYE